MHPYDHITETTCRNYASAKWHKYPETVLPLWVADMDYPIAEEIVEAVQQRIGQFIGYPEHGMSRLHQSLVERLQQRFNWTVPTEAIMFTPGVVRGIYAGIRSFTRVGEGVLTHIPVYHPFLNSIRDLGRTLSAAPLRYHASGWELDMDAMEAAITPETKVFLLCNPQNPTGRVLTRAELETLAEFVVRHNLYVVSDELHADLIFEGTHIPFASLSPEIAARTLTLYGPGKTFNLAGLSLGFMIATDAELKKRVEQATIGMFSEPNVLSVTATHAAYSRAGEWEKDTLGYLKHVRDHLNSRLASEFPKIKTAKPEGTYLQFLDFSDYPESQSIYQQVLRAGVGLNEGVIYGAPYSSFLRINFATSQNILDAALDRLHQLS